MVRSAIFCASGVSAASFEYAKEKAKIQSGLCDKCFLCFLKATGLYCAATSPRGGQIQNVIRTVKIPNIHHIAALVDELDIFDDISYFAAG